MFHYLEIPKALIAINVRKTFMRVKMVAPFSENSPGPLFGLRQFLTYQFKTELWHIVLHMGKMHALSESGKNAPVHFFVFSLRIFLIKNINYFRFAELLNWQFEPIPAQFR